MFVHILESILRLYETQVNLIQQPPLLNVLVFAIPRGESVLKYRMLKCLKCYVSLKQTCENC